CCQWRAGRQDPPSFPTRRSSDLGEGSREGVARVSIGAGLGRSGHGPLQARSDGGTVERLFADDDQGRIAHFTIFPGAVEIGGDRSEEHTSELQSREKLVCRLLLE